MTATTILSASPLALAGAEVHLTNTKVYSNSQAVTPTGPLPYGQDNEWVIISPSSWLLLQFFVTRVEDQRNPFVERHQAYAINFSTSCFLCFTLALYFLTQPPQPLPWTTMPAACITNKTHNPAALSNRPFVPPCTCLISTVHPFDAPTCMEQTSLPAAQTRLGGAMPSLHAPSATSCKVKTMQP